MQLPCTRQPPKLTQNDHIGAAVRSALRDSGYHILSEIDCDSFNGVVILSGVVPSYYMKQIAQTVVGKLEIVTMVENNVVVEYK